MAPRRQAPLLVATSSRLEVARASWKWPLEAALTVWALLLVMQKSSDGTWATSFLTPFLKGEKRRQCGSNCSDIITAITSGLGAADGSWTLAGIGPRLPLQGANPRISESADARFLDIGGHIWSSSGSPILRCPLCGAAAVPKVASAASSAIQAAAASSSGEGHFLPQWGYSILQLPPPNLWSFTPLAS